MAKKAKIEVAKKGAVKKIPFMNTFAGQAVMVFIAIACIVFLPTTFLLMIGMLPTFAALMVGMKGQVAKAYCVAATNLVGCFVFILELWSKGHNFENSVNIITNPVSIIVMYGAASIGYFLNWTLSSLMASVIQQRAKGRLVTIKEKQQALIEKWGMKVTGTIALDEDGFPILRE